MGALAPGSVIANRYRVVRPLGAGGMKTVYLAEDLRFQARRCALAVMVDNFTSSEARSHAVAGFEREADVLAQLDHPAIPKVSDRFSEQDHHYFVMDYVAGETLAAKLGVAGGRLGQFEAITLALQVCDTLDYLHSRTPPIVYRDLKPANIIVTPDGRIKLVDFGIARHFTRQGTNVGTIGYAAPEQYHGECDPRSDVYALGATLHHLLSGRDPSRFPFDFPPLSTLLPGCDRRLEQLVDDALKRDRDERLSSAHDFAKRLRAVAASAEKAEDRNRQQPGMRYCSGCGAQVPADASRCAACGTTVADSQRTVESGAEPQPAPVAKVRLCPQCGRVLPAGAATCPHCVRFSQSGPDPNRSPKGTSRFVQRALLATLLAAAGALLAWSFWGSGASVPWPIWIVAGLVLIALEVHYTRDFTLLCYGGSALLVGVMTILGVLNIWTQWIAFAVLSTALLFSAREWLRREVSDRPSSTELENIIGQSAIPLEDLPAYGFGKAELRGTTWTAHNASHNRILRGQRCKVMRINGLTLWIMPE
jgi:membrane protein implicated in regulation of membrane protease activity/RNA polymerase subunit RPABC4/transcription elongation factor Spt4